MYIVSLCTHLSCLLIWEQKPRPWSQSYIGPTTTCPDNNKNSYSYTVCAAVHYTLSVLNMGKCQSRTNCDIHCTHLILKAKLGTDVQQQLDTLIMSSTWCFHQRSVSILKGEVHVYTTWCDDNILHLWYKDEIKQMHTINNIYVHVELFLPVPLPNDYHDFI